MTTRWQPDTCSCVIDYDIDINGKLVYLQHVDVCVFHRPMGQGQPRFDAVVDESTTKNYAKQALMDLGLPEPQVSFDSGVVGKGRIVRLTIAGLTGQQRGQAIAAVAKFGAGKVVIV